MLPQALHRALPQSQPGVTPSAVEWAPEAISSEQVCSICVVARARQAPQQPPQASSQPGRSMFQPGSRGSAAWVPRCGARRCRVSIVRRCWSRMAVHEDRSGSRSVQRRACRMGSRQLCGSGGIGSGSHHDRSWHPDQGRTGVASAAEEARRRHWPARQRQPAARILLHRRESDAPGPQVSLERRCCPRCCWLAPAPVRGISFPRPAQQRHQIFGRLPPQIPGASMGGAGMGVAQGERWRSIP